MSENSWISCNFSLLTLEGKKLLKGNAGQVKHQLHCVSCEEMGEKLDLTEFEYGMIESFQSVRKGISKMVALVKCLREAVINVYKEWTKQKTGSKHQATECSIWKTICQNWPVPTEDQQYVKLWEKWIKEHWTKISEWTAHCTSHQLWKMMTYSKDSTVCFEQDQVHKGAQGLDSRCLVKDHVIQWIMFPITTFRWQNVNMKKRAQKHESPTALPQHVKLVEKILWFWECFLALYGSFDSCGTSECPRVFKCYCRWSISCYVNGVTCHRWQRLYLA